MVKKYNTYQIKTDDTLKSIAEALNKDPNEVARFHNIFAKQNELIGVEFPINLMSLYITPNISEKHIDNIPKVNFLYDRKLALKPFNKKLTYNFESYLINENETVILSCQKTVTYMQKIADYHLFEIDTLPNEETLSGIAIEFSFAVSKALYPIELVVSEEGNWIGIYKFELLAKRWQVLKPSIRDDFEGPEIEKRIAFYDILFQDEARCTQLLRKDIFLQAYFNNLYDNHTLGNFFERKVYVALLPNVAPVCYTIKQQVEEYVNPTNQIEIHQKGFFEDARSSVDFEYDLDEAYYVGDMPKGNYLAKYKINSTSNCIESVHLDCDLQLATSKEIKIIIELVEL